MLRKLLASLSVVAVIATGFVLSTPPTPAEAAPGSVTLANGSILSADNVTQIRDTFNGINAYRASKGLPPMRFSPTISTISQQWSNHLAQTDQFYHNPSYASQYPSGWRGAGEILAARWDTNAQGLVNQWINSPGHEALMVGNFNVMGIGITFTGNTNFQAHPRTYTMYGNTNFARYDSMSHFATYASVDEWVAASNPTQPNPLPNTTVNRIAGVDRFTTNAAVSRQYNTPSQVNTVYIASGEVFSDALSAASAAAQPGNALLLAQRDNIPTDVRNELIRLQPSTVVIVGGTTTLSNVIPAQVRHHLPNVTLVRLAGVDRFETSVMIAQYAFPNARQAYIASGIVFPDALSAAPVAAQQGAPVILSLPEGLTPAQQTYLRNAGLQRLTVAGGPTTIHPGQETLLRSTTGATITRVAGADRFETNRLLVSSISTGRQANVLVVSGLKFPDALSVAAVAPRVGPMLLATNSCYTGPTLNLVRSTYQPTQVTLVGGTDTLNQSVANFQSC